MKKYAIIILAAALAWPLSRIISTEPDPEVAYEEQRAAFRQLQDQNEYGQIPADSWDRASKQKELLTVTADAWREFLPATGVETPITLPWVSIGPGNIGGRIRSLVIHPLNSRIMWAGSVTGGIWKTTDGGMNWATNTDFIGNLNVSSLVMDPTDPDVLYAATGGGTERGGGIFKTKDAGLHWQLLGSTRHNPNFFSINHLSISLNGNYLLAGGSAGLFRSLDGGATWTQRITSEIFDLRFHPTKNEKCVVSDRAGHVFFSEDGGNTYTQSFFVKGTLPSPGNMRLAYARSNPSIVYAQGEGNRGQLFRSENEGHAFALRSQCCSSVAFWANCLWVDPTKPDTVVFGGTTIFRSTDGGLTGATQTYVNTPHNDHQLIVEDPKYNGTTNKTVYCTTDGGIFKTEDILNKPNQLPPSGESLVNWTSLNNSLGVTQFLGGAGNNSTGVIIGGAQDNGTLVYHPPAGANTWGQIFGGDGGYCAADQFDSRYFYGSFPNLGIIRSSNSGSTAQYIAGNLPRNCNGNVCSNFTAPFVLDPNNPYMLLAGGSDLWRSSNARWPEPSQIYWLSIKGPIGGPDNNYISAVAVAEGNPNLIWVGYNFGDVYSTANGTDFAPTWVRAGGLPRRFCSSIAITGPNDGTHRKVYVTFGGYSAGNVWKSDDGMTFRDISGVLPHLPIYTLAVSSTPERALYVGTPMGVFASTNDGGNSWSPSNDGPANVITYHLFWMGPKLVAATFGRGMFIISPSDPQ